MKKPPILFLSYSWTDQIEAERIYSDFKQIGVNVKMDNHELKYKDNILNFMKSIRDADFALILISESYLKSKNCMYESLQLIKEKDVENKILPIIIDNTNIFKTEERVEYIKFWQEKMSSLSNALKNIDPINALEAYNDLKTITEITGNIDNFIKKVSDMKNIALNKLRSNNYMPILKAIGYEDFTWAIDLLRITSLDTLNKKEIALDEYLAKHQPSSYYYAVKAQMYSKATKYEQAKINYLLSIKFKPDNFEALNNLGDLYERVFEDYNNAKEYYLKAIEAEPKLTIARLNLGVLLSHHFNDKEGAKKQYEYILSYDPNEARAHNNIANYYKTDIKSNKSKIIYHLRKAIEINPNYIEAYLNYANFLKLNGQIELGNEFYEKAKSLDKTGHYKDLIDALLKMDKG